MFHKYNVILGRFSGSRLGPSYGTDRASKINIKKWLKKTLHFHVNPWPSHSSIVQGTTKSTWAQAYYTHLYNQATNQSLFLKASNWWWDICYVGNTVFSKIFGLLILKDVHSSAYCLTNIRLLNKIIKLRFHELCEVKAKNRMVLFSFPEARFWEVQWWR